MTSYDGKAVTYDAIGNPLTYDGWNYTWEMGKQLATMSGNGYNISYKYNDSGIRTSKTVNGVSTNYHLVGDKVTYQTDGTDSIYYTYDAGGELISMNLNGVEYYYIRNGQSDIIGLFDNAGTQIVSYSYDTWGKLISITGSAAGTVGVKNPYRYRGYRYDTETGYYYCQSRYYVPEWGRWLNADGNLGNPGELLTHNLFAYCANNPVNMIDPDGTFAWALGGLYFIPGVGEALLAATAVVVVGGLACYGAYKAGQYIGQKISEARSKPVNLPSLSKLKINMEHITSGHSPGGNRNPKGKKDIFWGMSAAAIQKAIQEAYNVCGKIKTQGDSVLVRGFSKTYNYTIEIWVNLKDMVIKTAYPVD